MLTAGAVSEGHGDAALYLLKEGADSEKKDLDGRLAIDTAPDQKVRLQYALDHADVPDTELRAEECRAGGHQGCNGVDQR